MNTKSKGSRNERRSMRIFEAAGYQCTKSGASLGVFDIIGIGAKDLILCQVKTNAWPSAAEVEAIEEFIAPDNAVKLIHRWDDRELTPRVKVVT